MNLARRNVLSLLVSRKMSKFVREVSIPVPWGRIGGKWWGSTDIKPILSLHGLQDNSGTFDRLIPLLNRDISCLTIDLPGHGYSSHYPKGMSYDFLMQTLLVKRILIYFNWSSISLMGHSLGAMISYNFATLYPEKVDSLICLDSVKPVKEPLDSKMIRIAMDESLKFEKRAYKGLEPPCYTLEEIDKKISSRFNNSIELEYAHHISSRNISPSRVHPGLYYFSLDPLLATPIVMLYPQSQEELVEDAMDFSTPIFVCKSETYPFLEGEEKFYQVLDVIKKTSRDFEFHKVGGTHYLHLNEPEKIGKLIDKFLQKHHKFERSNVDSRSPVFSNIEQHGNGFSRRKEEIAYQG